MRLSQSLWKKIMPGGNIFTGRHRLQYNPDARTRDRVRWGLEVEENNMLYLRHPYLTKEQSYRHMAHIDRFGIEISRQRQERRDNWWKPVRLEDKLNHLRHTESWEK